MLGGETDHSSQLKACSNREFLCYFLTVSDKLSKRMRGALRVLLEGECAGISSATLKALMSRGLVDESSALTKGGRDRALTLVPLKTQCSMLGILYSEIDVPVSIKNPESKALKHYRKQGYNGIAGEGTPILVLIKAAILDFAVENRKAYESRADCCRVYVEAHLEIHKEKKDEIVKIVAKSKTRRIKKNLKEILAVFDPPGSVERFTVPVLLDLYKKLGRENIVKILEALLEDPYGYRKGWPDIIIWNKSEIRWVEIKAKDKLHSSQISTFQHFEGVVPGAIEVTKVNVASSSSWLERLTVR